MLVAGAMLGLRQAEDVTARDSGGRDRLLAACKELVRPNQPIEHVMEIVGSVFLPNSEPKELFQWWIEQLNSTDRAQASQWCVIGESLRCWSTVDLATVRTLLKREEVPSASVIAGLLHANRMDVLRESRVPGSGVRGRGSGEREATASSLAGKEESSRKEDNSGQGKDGPAGAIAQGGNGR